MALTFHPGDLDSSDVKALLELHFGMMRSISPPNACHVLPVDGLRDPAVTFWSARERGELVGVGALKELAADHGTGNVITPARRRDVLRCKVR